MALSPESTDEIAVIGAGWAGCAAAVTLAQAGRRVHLIEAGRIVGGRARRVEIDGRRLDNGQHILLGAYRASLKIMKAVGIDAAETMLRLPLQMRYPSGCDGMDFVAPRLPAPWHVLVALFKAKGLSGDDKLALARFSTSARWMDWQLHDDCSVTQLLERFDQTERLNALMWTPLCIAALNTPPERASAQVFLNVLRDSLGARRAASDMLLPRTDLSALFPEHAADFISRHGGTVSTGSSVAAIMRDTTAPDRWQLALRHNDQPRSYAGVVIATAAPTAASLLDIEQNELVGADAVPQQSLQRITALQYEPITTCYLQYPADIRLDQAFYALRDNPAQAAWGQFVFDRGQLSADPADAGLLAVVVSASGEAIALEHSVLQDAIAAQLAQQLQLPALATPIWGKLISEKRATFSCTPGLLRPDNSDMPAGLVLAGDYVAGDYPATLEGAVQSGIKAAQALLSKRK